MKQFIAKFADKVDGILCGFDRQVPRGELRALYIANGGGMEPSPRSSHVMFKDFGEHVLEVSRRLKDASQAAALELGRARLPLLPGHPPLFSSPRLALRSPRLRGESLSGLITAS